MKVEEAKKIADNQLEKLVKALEAGQSDSMKRYLAAMSKMYRYSFRNLLLIFSQKPDASHVAGFNTWKKLGRFVKKGEKGIVIILPIQFKREIEAPASDEETVTAFRAGYVFDVSQTDGEPFAEFATVNGEPGEHLLKLKALLPAHGISLEYVADLLGADGMSKGGAIVLRENLTPAQEFSTLVHEFAHELLHRGTSEPKSKTVRETEAEAVAYVVSEAIGLATNTASSDYIQLYRGDQETLKSSLDAIQKASSTILSGLFAEAET